MERDAHVESLHIRSLRQLWQAARGRTFAHWKVVAGEATRMRRRVRAMRRRTGVGLLQRHFQEWDGLLSDKARAEAKATKRKARAEEEEQKRKAREEATLRKILLRMRNAQMSSSFVRWAETAAEGVAQRGLVRRVAMRMQSKPMAQGFERWAEHVRQHGTQARKIVQVVGRLGRTRLRVSWRAWRVAHNTQMREREQTEVQVITVYPSSAPPALIPTAQPSANVREVTQAIVDEGDAHHRAVLQHTQVRRGACREHWRRETCRDIGAMFR